MSESESVGPGDTAGTVSKTEKETEKETDTEKGISTKTANTTSIEESKAEGAGEDKERGHWDNQVQFLLTCVGLAVGLGNIWRFPALAYENGGSAFLIPYITCGILFGLPMIYAEFILGQYTSAGPTTAFRKYAPAVEGIGWGMAGVSMSVAFYYTLVIAWAAFYMASAIIGDSPSWTTCNNEWNTAACSNDDDNTLCRLVYPDLPFAINDTCRQNASSLRAPAEEFFQNQVINRSPDIGIIGEFNWRIGISLIVMYILTYLTLVKGIEIMGKAAYVTSTMPYLIISIFFVRAITLPGAEEGIIYYLGKPDFSKILLPLTWAKALKQMCFSINVGFGGLLTLASYSKFNNNCYRDAWIVIIGDTFMSVFGGAAVFATLGYLSGQLGKPIGEVVESGTSLAFVAYPEAMSRMPISIFWAILFFLMLFFLGISSEVALIEVMCTGIYDSWPSTRNKKWLVSLIACIACVLMGVVMMFQGGYYWFELYDGYTGSVAPGIICALGAWTLSVIYGSKNTMDDIALMRGPRNPGFWGWFGANSPYWKFNWTFICPVLSLVITGMMLHGYITAPPKLDNYDFPTWAHLIGWLLAVSPTFPIVYFFFKNWMRLNNEGKEFMELFRIQEDHRSFKRLRGPPQFPLAATEDGVSGEASAHAADDSAEKD